MIDTYFRAPYQTLLLDPLLPTLLKWGFPPNTYTWGALICGTSILPACWFEQAWLALILLALSGFLDTVDGTVARAMNMSTPEGTVFDIVADRAVETAVIIGLYLMGPDSRSLLCLVMLGSVFLCITSFLVVGIYTRNESRKGFYYSPGIMERTEAFIFFGLMFLLPKLFFPLAVLFTSLVLLTTCMRVKEFRRRCSINHRL